MGQSAAVRTRLGGTIIRPKYGERRVCVRELFRTRIKVLRETVQYEKGARDLHGDPLSENEVISEGSVLVPIWNCRPKPQDYVYRDIYEAIRGQEFTRDGYEAPDGEIASLYLSVEAARAAIKTFISWGNCSREERRALNELLAALSVEHQGARNQEKKAAAEKFSLASKDLDSRGRQNPGARAARVVAGRNRLELRREQVSAICQAIGPRRTALVSELDRMWTDGWARVWRELTDAEEHLSATDGQVEDAVSLRRITDALDVASQSLEIVDVEPFLSARYTVLSEINLARGSLLRRRWNQACDEIRRSLEGIRFKRAGRELHGILLALALCAAGGRGGTAVVPANDVQRIRRLIGDFRERLAQLSERRLARPPKADVETLLGAAQEALLGQPSFARLEEAAEFLKGALAYL